MLCNEFGFGSVPLASHGNTSPPGDRVALLQLHSATQITLNDGKNSSKPCKPKRPLSAYNLFFKHEREKILAETPVRSEGKPRRSHGKIGFGCLARTIADKWKNIDDETRDYFEDLAAEDKARYKQEKKRWKKAKTRENKSVEGSQNTDNEQLAALLKGVLDDTVQDVRSFQDSVPTTSYSDCLSSTRCQQGSQRDSDINSNMNDCDEKELTVPSQNISSFGAEDLKSNIETMEQCSPTWGANHPTSYAEKNVLHKQSKSFSLLSFVSSASFCTTESKVYPENTASHVNKAPHVSELAAKLDDECIDLLCGW